MKFRSNAGFGTALCFAALAGLASLAVPAAAFASRTPAAHPDVASAIAGYARSEAGDAESYFAFDSADSAPDAVSISQVLTGQYQVTFAHLGSIASKAVVQLTTNDTTDTCSVGSWLPAGQDLQVAVGCFDLLTGAPSNGDFTVLVTQATGTPHGTFDYALNTRANTSGTLTSFQYNSAHKKNSVKFLGTGKYQLMFEGPKTSGTKGVVKVTPFGNAAGDCELVSWTGSGKGVLVNVDCYGPGHVLADRDFVVTYASANSLMGINGQIVANAFANSSAAVYQPAVQYDSVRGAKVTVVNLDHGQYEVFVAGSAGNPVKFGGDVQVSAVSSLGRHCGLLGWSAQHTPAINVACWDPKGKLVNSPFTVEWVVP